MSGYRVRSPLLVFADAGTEQEKSGEPGGRTRQVHNRRAGEVLRAEGCHQEAPAEKLVADERIDEGGKRDAEENVDDELRTLEHGPPDDRERYGAEDELEEPFRRRGNRAPGDRRQVELRAGTESRKETAAADEGEDATGSEGDAESDSPVRDRAHAQVGQDLGHYRAHILHPAEADLEHRETGLHEHDEAGGDDHPNRVGGDAGGPVD